VRAGRGGRPGICGRCVHGLRVPSARAAVDRDQPWFTPDLRPAGSGSSPVPPRVARMAGALNTASGCAADETTSGRASDAAITTAGRAGFPSGAAKRPSATTNCRARSSRRCAVPLSAPVTEDDLRFRELTGGGRRARFSGKWTEQKAAERKASRVAQTAAMETRSAERDAAWRREVAARKAAETAAAAALPARSPLWARGGESDGGWVTTEIA